MANELYFPHFHSRIHETMKKLIFFFNMDGLSILKVIKLVIKVNSSIRDLDHARF